MIKTPPLTDTRMWLLQQEGCWFEYWILHLPVWQLRHALPVSVWVFSGFLPQSKDMQIGFRLIGEINHWCEYEY